MPEQEVFISYVMLTVNFPNGPGNPRTEKYYVFHAIVTKECMGTTQYILSLQQCWTMHGTLQNKSLG